MVAHGKLQGKAPNPNKWTLERAEVFDCPKAPNPNEGTFAWVEVFDCLQRCQLADQSK